MAGIFAGVVLAERAVAQAVIHSSAVADHAVGLALVPQHFHYSIEAADHHAAADPCDPTVAADVFPTCLAKILVFETCFHLLPECLEFVLRRLLGLCRLLFRRGREVGLIVWGCCTGRRLVRVNQFLQSLKHGHRRHECVNAPLQLADRLVAKVDADHLVAMGETEHDVVHRREARPRTDQGSTTTRRCCCRRSTSAGSPRTARQCWRCRP